MASTPIVGGSDRVLEAILAHNAQRLNDAQAWSLVVYWLIGLAMCFHTAALAVVAAWATSGRLVSSLPDADDVRYAALYWLYPLLLLNFLITAGAGMIGWGVVGAVYTLLAFGLAVRGQWSVWQTRAHRATGNGPLLNSDGTVAVEQEALERELLKQFLAQHQKDGVTPIQLRVARTRRVFAEKRGGCMGRPERRPSPCAPRGDGVALIASTAPV